MNEDINKLLDLFKNINKEGYIEGINRSNNSCGLTFEKLINKKADSKFTPDFNSIEIKTTQRYSRYSIGLFNLTFDGPEQNESNYLLNKYGFLDKEYGQKKLIVNLKYNEKVSIYGKYYFELKLNHNEQRLEIIIYNPWMKIIETRGYISFNSLKERINIKLQYLALVFASKKSIADTPLFRYYKIIFYKLKGFNAFIKLIEVGDIEVVLMLRFARSGINVGTNKNKGISFKIKKDKVDNLFEEIYRFED